MYHTSRKAVRRIEKHLQKGKPVNMATNHTPIPPTTCYTSRKASQEDRETPAEGT
jgi:hypothetical protein